jgi:hypothetical protein
MKNRPFDFGSEETLGVWVNLMLDKVSGKMIDWRKVDDKLLEDFNRFSGSLEVIYKHLKGCLSSTYLDEMINN